MPVFSPSQSRTRATTRHRPRTGFHPTPVDMGLTSLHPLQDVGPEAGRPSVPVSRLILLLGSEPHGPLSTPPSRSYTSDPVRPTTPVTTVTGTRPSKPGLGLHRLSSLSSRLVEPDLRSGRQRDDPEENKRHGVKEVETSPQSRRSISPNNLYILRTLSETECDTRGIRERMTSPPPPLPFFLIHVPLTHPCWTRCTSPFPQFSY